MEQSSFGNHILFDNETIKRVKLADDSEVDPALKQLAEREAEHLFEKLVTFPTIEAKRIFLGQLDPKTYVDVVRVYLNVVLNQTKTVFDQLH